MAFLVRSASSDLLISHSYAFLLHLVTELILLSNLISSLLLHTEAINKIFASFSK